MSATEVTVKIEGLNEAIYTVGMFPGLVTSKIPVILGKAGDIGVSESRRLVRVATGTLRDSIFYRTTSRAKLIIGASAPYGVIVEKGSRAHIITPRNRRALRFETAPGARKTHFSTGQTRWRGAGGRFVSPNVIFTKFVMHPGTKAYPFIAPGAKKAADELPRLTWDEVREWLRSKGWE